MREGRRRDALVPHVLAVGLRSSIVRGLTSTLRVIKNRSGFVPKIRFPSDATTCYSHNKNSTRTLMETSLIMMHTPSAMLLTSFIMFVTLEVRVCYN